MKMTGLIMKAVVAELVVVVVERVVLANLGVLLEVVILM